MSQFKVEVVEITSLEKHPNADSLSIVQVFGYPVIVRTADWKVGDRAAYIPVDAVVPDREMFSFLDGHNRIRAKRLRGIFSQGLLMPAPDGASIGDDVAEGWGVIKYEPPEPAGTDTEAERPPDLLAPVYTEIEHLRRYRDKLVDGEHVVVTEKIHGANGRWVVDPEGVLHVGSHHQWKKESPSSIWWKVVTPELREFLSSRTILLYGEVFGWVQDLRYGASPGQVFLRAFDAFDYRQGRYLDWPEFGSLIAQSAELKEAPICGVIPYSFEDVARLAEEDSWLTPDQMSEGIVVRPIHERYDPEIGRVILKLHSERYLLKKG